MIPVTKPFFPPISEYNSKLVDIWHRQWLTNMGPLASELEMALKDYLNVNHLLYVTNGTIALQLAIKALDLKGEIITTPFSFVATTSAISWEGCTPVFVDIDANTCNIDPKLIEEAITPNTVAILATHVYGNPCDVEAIAAIADKYNLKVIYDGAHAFSVNFKGRSIFNFGDLTTCSFHATKLYHTVEGGAVVTNSADLTKKLAFMRNFGIKDFESFSELGINGKNSELHAAMGIVNLSYVDEIIKKRQKISERYDANLSNLKAYKPKWNQEATKNYAYYPIIFDDTDLMIKCFELLKVHEIFARRYFYPSLSSSLPYLPSVTLPNAERVSNNVICLPLYDTLSFAEVDLICRLLLRAQNN